MTKKSTYLLGIVLTIIIGAIVNWWLCCKGATYGTSTTEDSTVATSITKEKVSVPLILRDLKGDFDYSTTDNINFNHSSKEILEPLSLEVDTGVLRLTKYVGGHPEKNIDITGYYTADEVYDGSFPNLGIARATSVKNYIISKGIASKQINVFGERKDSLTQQDSILIGPVDFTIQSIDTTAVDVTAAMQAKLDTLKASIQDNPLVLEFKTGQSAIHLDAAQRQKVADISTYLDKADDAKCIVVGHTDNTGDPSTHDALGQKRADFARDYLIKNGILPEKIEAISKGDREPIAPNTTAEGRAKNRRTVITIN